MAIARNSPERLLAGGPKCDTIDLDPDLGILPFERREL